MTKSPPPPPQPPPPPYKVGVDFLVVPDGIAADGRLRLNVSLSPSFRGVATVDLVNWPSEVAAIFADLKAALADIQGTVDSSGAHRRVQLFNPSVPLTLMPPVADQMAVDLWHRIFALGNPSDPQALQDGIGWLYAALKDRAVGPPAPPGGASFQVGTYQYKEIARWIDDLYSAVAADGLVRRAVRRSCAEAGVPIPPGFRGNELDLGAGWWCGLNRDWFDADSLEDPVSRLARRGAPGTALETAVHAEMENNWTAFTGDQWTALLNQGTMARMSLRAPGPTLQERIAAPGFWADGGPPDLGTGPLRREMARLRAARGLLLVQPDPSKASGDYDITPEEDAGRKFAAILSHPTVSKFLGLHVDLTAPADALGKATPGYGAISVYAGKPPTQTPDTTSDFLWTAYVRREAPGDVSGYFGPCGRSESVKKALQPDQPIVDGLLNLNVQVPGGGDRRFVLECVDVDTTSIALAERSRQFAQALRNGTTAKRGSTALPDTPVPGIRLVDQMADTSAQQKAIRSRQFSAAGGAATTQVRDAEDLVEGYRVECALAASDGSWRKTNRWRSLTARTVNYPNAGDMPANYLKQANIRALAQREDGQVRPMVAMHQGTSSLTNRLVALVVARQVLFTWTGDSVAVKGRPDVARGEDIDAPDEVPILPEKDLAIDIDTDVPTSGAGRPPPLREGRAYMFGARARFTNGCGVPLERAVARYVAKPVTGPGLALGEDDSKPFTFERRAAILAPDVLLPWRSPIVTEDATHWRGETVEHLVIRTRLGSGSSSFTQRYLLPPRARFELLEQEGVFDTVDSPRGAFSGEVGLEMDPDSGALPIAADGTWHFPKPQPVNGSKPPPPAKRDVSRGTVLVLRTNVQGPWSPYFVDPACRRVQAKFVPDGDPESDYGIFHTPVTFWEEDETPDRAMPMLIELKRKYGSPDKFAVFDEDDTDEGVVPKDGSDPVELRKIAVALNVGESVDLEICAALGPEHANGHKYIRAGLGLLRGQYGQITGALQAAAAPRVTTLPTDTDTALAALGAPVKRALSRRLNDLVRADGTRARKALSELLSDGAVAPAVRKRIVRLVHAVDKPLKTPAFRELSNGVPDIHPVVIKGVAGSGKTDAQAQWADYVAAAQCQPIDQLAWPSEEQGATTFFVGSLSIDRATSARVRCDASWFDYGADTMKRDVDNRTWVKSPTKGAATLFSIDEIPFAGTLRGAAVDLIANDSGALRSLFYAFKDGRAREVSLQLVATSRFTDYFPPVPGACDNAGPSLEKPAARIWVPCTFRPPAPSIDHVKPLFNWSVDLDRRHRKVTFTRTPSLRVYLKPDWWASGQGEQLGLICATDDQALHSRFAADVSRWGIDPTRVSAGVSNALSWKQVSNPATHYDDNALGPRVVHDVTIANEPQPSPPPFPDGDNARRPCPSPVPPSPAPEAFSVVAFDPLFDANDGLYCDIHLDPGESYWPFVEMHLVRYQGHAVNRYRVSPSTPFVTQVMPRRSGSAWIERGRKVAFDYFGYGYTKTATGAPEADQLLANTPLLNVKLLMAYAENDLPWDTDGHLDWRAVLDDHGQPVQLLHLQPRLAPDGQMVWADVLPAPRFDPEAHYGLLFEEVELGWIDDPGMVLDTCAPTPHVLGERGPTLHRVVRLWRDD